MSSSLRTLTNLFRSTTAVKPAPKTPKPAVKPAPKTPKPAAKHAAPPKTAAKTRTIPPNPISDSHVTPDSTKKFNYKRLAKKLKSVSSSDEYRIYRVNKYVGMLAAANQHSLIEEAVQHQKLAGDITDESFAIKLIAMCGRSGMFDNAHQLFDELPVKTSKSFNALLAASVYAKKFDRTEEVFREVPNKFDIKPDAVSYNILIKSYCELGSLDLALNVIDKMESAGLKLDFVTFNTLLAGAYKENRVDEAEKLWSLMGTKNVVPDARSYDSKLKYLLKMDKNSEVVVMFEEMKSKGIKPDRHSYYLLITGYCEKGDLEETKRWYDELELKNMRPVRQIFEKILPFVCDKDDIEYAFKLSKQVIRWKCIVDVKVLQDVVNKFVEASKIDEAKELIALANTLNYYSQKLKLPIA